MNRSRFSQSLAIFCTLCCLPLLRAQTVNIAPRVVSPIDDNNRVTLTNSMSSLTRPVLDRGAASPAAVLPYVRLVLSRSQAQEAALQKFMAQQLDPHSPNYHHWLTPQEFGKLYGPSDSDVAAIVGWLQSHGFKVETVPSGRVDIAFTGSVAQIEASFHTSIHTFQYAGQQYFGNVTPPQIPAALAPVVSGIARLTTFQPRSDMARGPSGHYDPQAKRLVKNAPENSGPSPQFTVSSGGSDYLYVVPADAATIYDTPNSYNLNFSNSATSYNGSGVTIGIAGDAAITPQVVQNFRSLFLNGDTTAPTITNIDNSAVLGGDSDEAYLDNEISGGIAPGATIHFYTADDSQGGISAAVEQALQDNTVDILNLSFGECEDHLTTSGNQLIESWWQQAATDGIAVTASTGDSGSAGCDNQNKVTVATEGFAVSGFSSTPYNIAVGGTDYVGLIEPNGFSTYANTNSTSTNFYRSALQYIPESPWNDSSDNIGPLAQNTYALNNSSQTDIIGGTGGFSSCSTNGTAQSGTPPYGSCTSGYSKPSWQTGAGVPNDNARDVPDVSFLAGNGFFGALWLICTDQDQTTVNSTMVNDDCSSQSSSPFGFYFSGSGGTSAAAPAFAGILALVEQKVGSRLGGSVLQELYTLYNGAQGSSVFHDVNVGNNSVPCTSGTPNCSTNTAGYLYLTGYDATAGYDLASGLGSVDATQLVAAFGSSSSSPSISLSNGGNITVAPGASGTSTLTVAPSGGFTGVVNFVCAVSGSPAGLTCSAPPATIGTSSATATLTVDTSSSTPAGTYTATVTASDAATGNVTATTSLSITVSGSTSPSISLSNGGNISLTAGANGNTSLTVTPAGGFTGAVNLSCSVSSTPAGLTCSAPAATVSGTASATATLSVATTSSTPAGTYTATITASDAATGNITATTSLTITVTSGSSSGTYSLAASTPGAIGPGSTASSTITVSTSNGYSGTVSFTCTLTTSPNGAVDPPNCSPGNPVTLSGSGSGTTTVSVSTTAASSSSLDRRGLPGWLGAGGGTALALLIFWGIPARRRSWRNLLGLLVAFAVLGSLSACGGGGSSSNGNGNSGNSGTSAGAYVFTVTGTGNPSGGGPYTAQFTVTVN